MGGFIMTDYHEQQLNKHMYQLDEDSAKDEAIELLAEQLMVAAFRAMRDVLTASNYDLTASDTHTEANKEEFNDMYYGIAERLIKVSGDK